MSPLCFNESTASFFETPCSFPSSLGCFLEPEPSLEPARTVAHLGGVASSFVTKDHYLLSRKKLGELGPVVTYGLLTTGPGTLLRGPVRELACCSVKPPRGQATRVAPLAEAVVGVHC